MLMSAKGLMCSFLPLGVTKSKQQQRRSSEYRGIMGVVVFAAIAEESPFDVTDVEFLITEELMYYRLIHGTFSPVMSVTTIEIV